MIALVVPLAAVLAQSLPVGPDPATSGYRDGDDADRAGGAAAIDDPAPATPVGPPRRRAPRRRALDPAAVRALFAADPPVDALRAAATELAMAEPARARALVGRARYAGLLPELRVLVERRFARTESVDLGSPTDATALAPVGIDSNDDVRYQCRATWDLSRFVFNPDELAAQAQALRTADVRREIEALVIRLVFERRRLKVEAASVDAPDMSSSPRIILRTAEIEAELDALTGGAFTRLARHPADGAAAEAR